MKMSLTVTVLPLSQKKGWVTAKGDPVKNKEELILLDAELTAHKELEVK